MGLFSKPRPTPLDGIDVVLADLDGVVYAGPSDLPHAVASLNQVAQSRRVGYITNNASRTDAAVAEHLTSLGLTVAPRDVVTSPQAAMRLLKDMVPAPAKLLIVGGEGLVVEAEKAGYTVTRSADDAPDAVVQGFATDVAWTDLAEASFALKVPEDEGGIPWIATNSDWTIPRERGVAPGNGTLVSAVHTAIGRLATIAGKPEQPIFEEALDRFGAAKSLFIGDRLDTDISGAVRAGIDTALVLTGIDRPKHVLAAPEGSRPTFILSDLRELHEPYPLTQRKDGAVSVGGATVRVVGGAVEILAEGTRQIDLVRAGATAIWESGTPVFVLHVPEKLYEDPFFRP